MSEGASSVAIAQRINAGHTGAKLIVNLDVTALVDLNPGVFQAEGVGVRHTTDSEKGTRTNDCLVAAAAINVDGHFGGAFLKAGAFRAPTDPDTFVFEV